MRCKFWIIALGCLFNACTSDVPGNLGLEDYERQVVVNAGLTPGTPPEIEMVWSKGVLETGDYSRIENATVELIGETGTLELVHTERGKYVANKNIEEGENYRLEIRVDDRELTASDWVPELIEIDQLNYQDSVFISTENGIFGLLQLSFKDQPNTANFYELRAYQIVEGSEWACDLFTNNLSVVNASSTDLISDSRDQISSALIEDRLFDGQNFNFEIYVWPNSAGDPIYVHLKSVSPTYFDYLKAIDLSQTNGDSPFVEPVTIPTNISGGLGIFVGYTFDEGIVNN